MSEIAQLKQQLKSLKLSGAAESLELRIMESVQNELSFAELLSLILEDEVLTRQNKKLQRLLSQAKLNSNKTIETFDFTFNSSINAQQIRAFATCRFIQKNENIFFVGPTGTGKTHLSKAIGHIACRKYLSVGFFNFHDLFLSMHQADINGKLDKQLRSIIKYDLLIIDDFAFKKIDQKMTELLYAIVDARYGNGSIILTANRSMSDWTNIFPDPITANALMDRLCHNAHQIIIKGESYRRKLNPNIGSI